MDLVATVRKTGSRGGVNFNWEDVATSSRREHYLGHSLKAPVGRWQQGRDLNWYAKDKEDGANEGEEEDAAAKARRDELRRVKEAEEEAMALALGLPPGTSIGGGARTGSSAGTGAVSGTTATDSDATETINTETESRETKEIGTDRQETVTTATIQDLTAVSVVISTATAMIDVPTGEAPHATAMIDVPTGEAPHATLTMRGETEETNGGTEGIMIVDEAGVLQTENGTGITTVYVGEAGIGEAGKG
ncbi:hypothetical protein SEPCBS119000_001411 [Sporothrix epigloea]|uniref:Multiple myeloma tumor-associated protein 2-like N-terminal domain-containing protein n=1 Tax=Sporothrix epigloea TaxID=1892477 RepID=A0ABP0DD53_9PEZI